jgi:hypothetical protein
LGVSLGISSVIAAAPHHVLGDFVEVGLDPRGESARDHLVGALQFAVVESLLAVFNFLPLVLLQRLLDLGQADRPLAFSLLGLGASIARVVLGRLQVVDPGDACQPELLLDLGLVTLADGEFFALCSRDHAGEGL